MMRTGTTSSFPPAHGIGTARGLETRVVPAAASPLELIPPVPLPRKPDGDLLRVPGRLRGAVKATIKRDPYGVPHVYSDTDAGAIFGVGYVAATDQSLLLNQARYKKGIPFRCFY